MKKVILIPGSFKPFHDGHLSLIESYLKSDFKPDLIRFLISKKDRDGISAPVTLKFMKKVLKKFKDVVEVEVCDLPSPITECYDIIIHTYIRKDNRKFKNILALYYIRSSIT